MAIIPERLRGRTFALLRMLMQGTGPLGSTAAGFLLPVAGLTAMIALTSTVIGSPGPLGYQVSELRSSGGSEDREAEAPPETLATAPEAGS